MKTPKAIKRLEHVGGPLSPDQFDAVMASYAGTQRQGLRTPMKLPRRSPGHLDTPVEEIQGA